MVATQSTDHSNHFTERWCVCGRAFPVPVCVEALPLAALEHDVCRDLWVIPTDPRHVQQSPRHDHVESDTGLKGTVRLKLSTFDATAALERPEVDFDDPAA